MTQYAKATAFGGGGGGGGGTITGAQNIGSGAELFAGESGGVLDFRTLLNGPNISIQQNASEVVISQVPPGTNVCQIERTGVKYADFATAIAALQNGDKLFVFAGDHSALAADFSGSSLSDITVVGQSALNSINTRMGTTTIGSNNTRFLFTSINIHSPNLDSLTDNGSEETKFYNCHFSRASGSVCVRVSGAASVGPRFDVCFFDRNVSLNGTNFTGFVNFNYCSWPSMAINSSAGSFIRNCFARTQIQILGNSYVEINDSDLSFLESTQIDLGFDTLVLNNVRLRNQGTGFSSFITKTGTCSYRLLEVDFDVSSSTLNGDNNSEAYPVNFSMVLSGKTIAQLNALPRVRGQIHFGTDTKSLYVDDGLSLLGLMFDPMTTRGDVVYRDATNTTARLPVGGAGEVLTSDGTDVSWQPSAGGGFPDPMTNPGDMIVRDILNTTTRLPVGLPGQVLTAGIFSVAWADGFVDPMTTQGDLIFANILTDPDRLPIGTAGQVLTVVGGEPAWQTPGGGGGGQTLYDAIVDAAGGGDYTLISSAVSAEAAGATIFVRNGVYNEGATQIQLKEGQKIIGQSETGVVIESTTTVNAGTFAFDVNHVNWGFRDESRRDTNNVSWITGSGMGQVTMTNSSPTVTFTGLSGSISVGDSVIIGKDFYAEVSSVGSGTFDMDRDWTGVTGSVLDIYVSDVNPADPDDMTQVSNLTIKHSGSRGNAFFSDSNVYGVYISNITHILENPAVSTDTSLFHVENNTAAAFVRIVDCTYKYKGSTLQAGRCIEIGRKCVNIDVTRMYSDGGGISMNGFGGQIVKYCNFHFVSISNSFRVLIQFRYTYRVDINIDAIISCDSICDIDGLSAQAVESYWVFKGANGMAGTGEFRIRAENSIFNIGPMDGVGDLGILDVAGSTGVNILDQGKWNGQVVTDDRLVIGAGFAYQSIDTSTAPLQNNGYEF